MIQISHIIPGLRHREPGQTVFLLYTVPMTASPWRSSSSTGGALERWPTPPTPTRKPVSRTPPVQR